MPTPSNRTVLRLARGTYSNLNSSVSDLQEGEPCYATDENRIYVKEGSSLVDTQADVSLKANIASPTFTGTVTIPTGASIADYAPLASPTFTGTVTIPSGASIADYAPLASPTFTGTPTVPGYAALAGATFSGKITAQVATVGEIDEIADDAGGTVTISLDTSANYKTATFAAARTLANPSAKTIGACGSIFVTGPGFTGYGSQWMFPGGTGPTYTNTASKWDRIDFIVLDASTIMCNFTANYGAPS